MEIRELSRAELAALYADELTHTFPPAELKPLRAMEQMMNRGCYHPLGLWENGAVVSYMLLWTDRAAQYALVDYLGTTPSRRGGGLGAEFLHAAFETFPQYRCFLVEAEAPNSGDPQVDALRRRRLDFYLRAGLRQLDYDCALFGVHYHCFARGDISDREALRGHQAIYAQQFSPAHLERFIQLPLRPGEPVKPASDWIEG